MTADELRRKYLDFFRGQGHKVMASASLIPENDPTVLFTTAGMHPLVPYLLGETHPDGQRLASAQKCVRTGDIEEVGDLTHLTFFEMLGNWSLGNYFKKEAIDFSFEFLTGGRWLGLDKNKLAVSVFAGDHDAPFDRESFDHWLGKGLAKERIARLGKDDNWWGPAGQTGPCGPDTEMFYWTGTIAAPADFQATHDDPRWVEIWNDVFMAYGKTTAGNFEPLAAGNVDTGMGLERTLAVMNGLDDVYQTDLFWPMIELLEKLSGSRYQDQPKPFRIIADHLKAAVMIMGDDKGLAPANTDQGYIVRRLIRRAARYGRLLNLEGGDWTKQVVETVIEMYGDIYPEVKRRRDFIQNNLREEMETFTKTLARGLKELQKLIIKKKGEGDNDVVAVSGANAFNIFSTYGFPFEMIEEELQKEGLKKGVSKKEFDEELKRHQELSRTSAAGKFKGGLADHSDAATKLHTATHLLLAALRKVLGDHVWQKGSNITPERLRLDFSHPDKLTPGQLSAVSDLVNRAIQENLPVSCETMPLEQAREIKAMGVFESKYSQEVKVYTVGEATRPFSREICGGPHVTNTAELGHFRIVKEEASSAGVRRVKAILE